MSYAVQQFAGWTLRAQKMPPNPDDIAGLTARAEAGETSAQIDLAFYFEGKGDAGAAAKWMDAAAESGDSLARMQRAAWRLYGSNFERDEAAALREIEDIAETGANPAAPTFAAVLRAAGLGAASDWNAATNWLARAAFDDEPRALAQLSLLQPDTDDGRRRAGLLLGRAAALGYEPALSIIGEEPAPATPKQSTALIVEAADAAEDPSLWRPSEHQIFLKRPRVDIYPHTAPALWRRYIIETATPLLQPAQVKDANTGKRADDPMRTNRVAIIELWNSDLIFYALTRRIAAAMGEPLERQEAPRVLHYRPGEAYAPHFDFVNPEVPAFARELSVRGQRIKTPLIYLNDDYAGGATSFPEANDAYKARAGDLLILRNTRSSGKPDPRSLHAGTPPIRGDKWVMSARTRSKPQIARIWSDF